MTGQIEAVRRVFPPRRRDRPLYRVHAAGRRPQLGSRRPSSPWTRFVRLNAWHALLPVPPAWSNCPLTQPVRPRNASPSATASARSASSHRSHSPSADTAAASASPPTERSAPACSRSPTTIYTAKCVRGGTDAELDSVYSPCRHAKEARHHIGEPGFEKPSRNMVHIGG